MNLEVQRKKRKKRESSPRLTDILSLSGKVRSSGERIGEGVASRGGVAAEGSHTTKAEVAYIAGQDRVWSAGEPSRGVGLGCRQRAPSKPPLALGILKGRRVGGLFGSAAWRGTTSSAVIRRRPSGGGSAGASGRTNRMHQGAAPGAARGTRRAREQLRARRQGLGRSSAGVGLGRVRAARLGRLEGRDTGTGALGLSQIKLGLDDRWAPLKFQALIYVGCVRF